MLASMPSLGNWKAAPGDVSQAVGTTQWALETRDTRG